MVYPRRSLVRETSLEGICGSTVIVIKAFSYLLVLAISGYSLVDPFQLLFIYLFIFYLARFLGLIYIYIFLLEFLDFVFVFFNFEGVL
jgi:hypothetical protein